MSAVSYFAGTLIALLMFARLSNYLGRRPVVFATLGLTAIACLIFFYIHNASMLFIGRFIQGVVCGLASSTITAYVVDNAPASPAWLGAAVTSGALTLAVFTCMMAPIAIDGSLSGRLEPGTAQCIGMFAFFLSMVAVFVTLRAGVMAPFLIATVIAGITQGAAFTGSMRELLDKTSQQDRAGVLSA